jgi:hypothetical protein
VSQPPTVTVRSDEQLDVGLGHPGQRRRGPDTDGHVVVDRVPVVSHQVDRHPTGLELDAHVETGLEQLLDGRDVVLGDPAFHRARREPVHPRQRRERVRHRRVRGPHRAQLQGPGSSTVCFVFTTGIGQESPVASSTSVGSSCSGVV